MTPARIKLDRIERMLLALKEKAQKITTKTYSENKRRNYRPKPLERTGANKAASSMLGRVIVAGLQKGLVRRRGCQTN